MTLKAHKGRCSRCGHDHSAASLKAAEPAPSEVKALSHEEIAAGGLGLEYVHSVLCWAACGYVHTPERIANLHTSYRIVDRLVNAAPPAAPEPVLANPAAIAHELWAAAQLAPGEGIEDGVSRIEGLITIQSYGQEWNGQMPPDFLEYVKRNYSGEVVFSDPLWHAVRLWRAAMKSLADRQLARAPVPAAGEPKKA